MVTKIIQGAIIIATITQCTIKDNRAEMEKFNKELNEEINRQNAIRQKERQKYDSIYDAEMKEIKRKAKISEDRTEKIIQEAFDTVEKYERQEANRKTKDAIQKNKYQ